MPYVVRKPYGMSYTTLCRKLITGASFFYQLNEHAGRVRRHDSFKELKFWKKYGCEISQGTLLSSPGGEYNVF